MTDAGGSAGRLQARMIVAASTRLNWALERLCAALVAVMVAIVWLGIFSRYGVKVGLELGVTWTEELARYVMIWAALLAVPCGAYYREHIGLGLLLERFPDPFRQVLRTALDLCGLAFFLFLFVFGVGMVSDGAHQYATIFGMTMALPFASVPVATGLTVLQIAATMVREATSIQVAGQA